MPSGKTHDAITLILAAPTFAGTFVFTRDAWLATVVTVGFLFGGLMFGPDLDTVSKQYSRWSVFRILWFPIEAFSRIAPVGHTAWCSGASCGSFILWAQRLA